jgi:(4S)-4-hydroxy-5-phosphonooxypentane-2,3-dione isomerase
MNGHVYWFVELALRPGALTDFERLTQEMVATSLLESGTLLYQRALSPETDIVIAHEWYQSSEAALIHLRRFHAQFDQRFSALIDRRAFTVVGNVSAELHAVLSALGARFFAPTAGFDRIFAQPGSEGLSDGNLSITDGGGMRNREKLGRFS